MTEVYIEHMPSKETWVGKTPLDKETVLDRLANALSGKRQFVFSLENGDIAIFPTDLLKSCIIQIR